MSSLSVYHVSSPQQPDKVLTHLEDIASTLAERGVLFEQCEPVSPIPPDAGEAAIIAAYRSRIDRLLSEHGHDHVRLIDIDGRKPEASRLPAELLEEHRVEERETRICVAGRELVMLRLDDYVYAVLCEKGDILSIPANTRRWFDAGEHPRLISVSLSGSHPAAAVMLTGDNIASLFSGLED